eukprot:comp24156_c0_seq1/m.44001 comp24156_c0_seq1/g.44001  ORF comp24156_c0_seq1/g.44001 comp24156_c0_seq1/m.44001 type:complete len:179 (-) comp24156_c0_seq1:3332-3868(-)
MSVAALSAKRDLDSFLEGPVSPSHRSSPSCRTSSFSKRVRLSPPLQMRTNPQSHTHQQHVSSSGQNERVVDDDENIPTTPYAKRARHDSYMGAPSSPSLQYHGLPSPPRDLGGEVLFTLDQVRSIVSHALEEKDASMRALYDRLLSEKLTEQFNAFAKFNEDHIHRFSHQGDDLHYMC